MKKIISAVLCLLTVLLSLTGCAGNIEETDEKTLSGYKNHLDISISYWLIDDAFCDRENDEVLKHIEDKFNVTFVPKNVTWDDYYEKVLQWADSGALPDVFTGAYRTDDRFEKMVLADQIHEIPADLEKYPNLEKYLDSLERKTCLVNDKMYCIFRQTYSEQAETVKDRTILYRWDLAKKAGVKKEPSNWTEFRDMIKKIISADPEGKNIAGMTAKGYTMLAGLLLNYSVPMGSTGGSNFYWVRENDKLMPALFAGENIGDKALPAWRLIRTMYDEGTIERDILLTSIAQAEEKFLTGKSAAICIDGGISNTKLYENIGVYWTDYHDEEFWDDVKYLNLMPDIKGELTYPVWDYAWSETYISSKVSDEKLDRILAIYDYLLSEEGVILSNFGIKDKTYTVTDDRSIELIGDKSPSDVYRSIKALSSLVCWNYGNLNMYRFPNVVPKEYVLYDAERVDAARKCKIPEYTLTSELSNLGVTFNIDINDIFARMLVSSEPVEKVWNEIIDEYKAWGLEDLINRANK